MPHKRRRKLLSCLAVNLALAIVLFTLASDSNAQETLQPYATPILHTFLDSANVYPESVDRDKDSPGVHLDR